MIYGQDEPVLFPTMDLYDQGAMQMYITALRDQYQQGLKDQEDFYTKFGDFTSPIAKDVEQWDKRVVSPVTDMIDAMYAQGIDPVRNPEARQMILRQIHKTPRSWANKARERAKAADEYVKNRAALQRAGRWSSDFEKFRLGGKTLETWDPEADGEWTETSPAEYQTLQEFVHPSFAQLKPRALSQEDVEHRGGELFPELNYQYNPMYDYTGITEGDMRRSLEQYLPGIMGNPTYDYYYDIARRQVAAETGNANPSEKDVYKRFVDNAIQADSQVLNPFDYDINKIALADYEHRQRMAEARYRASLRRPSPSSEEQPGSGNGGNGNKKQKNDGISIYERLYNRGLANAVNSNPIYGDYKKSTDTDLYQIADADLIYNQRQFGASNNNAPDQFKRFQNRYEINADREILFNTLTRNGFREVVQGADGQNGIMLQPGDTDFISTEKDVVEHTYGYHPKNGKIHISEPLRNKVENLMRNGKTVTVHPLGKVYAAADDNKSYSVKHKAYLVYNDTDEDGVEKAKRVPIYWDYGLSTPKLEQDGSVEEGLLKWGLKVRPSDKATINGWVNQDGMITEPDYEKWPEFGPADTQVTHKMLGVSAPNEIRLGTF